MAFDTTPLTRPRRILTAVLLFAFLAGGTGGIVGLATASQADAPSAGPVHIPAPETGDRGTYRLRVVDLPEPGADTEGLPIEERRDSGELEFEFRPMQSLVDAAGTPHQVQVLAYDDKTPATENHTNWDYPVSYGVLVDRTSYETVAFLNEWTVIEEEETDEGTLTEYGESKSIRFHDDIVRPDPLPICGMLFPLQGTTVEGGETGSGMPACRYASSQSQARGDYEVIGTVQEGDRRYTVVEADDGEADILLWYEDGLPVPSRVEVEPHGLFSSPHTLVAELIAYTSGDGPADLPAPRSPVAIDLSPTTTTLFDETGIEHPFPVSEAYEVALEMEESGLAAFMEEHPEAYIWDASYWQFHRIEEDQTWFEYEWRLAFRAPDDLLHVHIGKSTEKQPVPVAESGDPLEEILGGPQDNPPEDQEPGYYLFSASTRDLEYFGDWMPRPDKLPTVASMWAYYDAMAYGEAEGLEPNMWSWTILPSRDDHRIIINAGRWQDTPYPHDGDYRYYREWAYLEWEFQDAPEPYRYNQRFRVTSLPDSPQPGQHAELQAETIVLVGWRLPPGAAVAIGAGAGLIALVYYVWPVLKSGAVGAFFSRVQADTALDNPTRARLFELVRQSPGIHFQELVRTAGTSENNARHHLRKLEQVHLVQRRQTSGYTCFFERGAVDRHLMAALPAVRSPTARAILESVQQSPGISNAALAKQLSLAPATVSYHLNRLRQAGLVIKDGKGSRISDLAQKASAS